MSYVQKSKRELTKSFLLEVLDLGVYTINLVATDISNAFVRHYLDHGKINRERLAYRLNRLEREGYLAVSEKDDIVTVKLEEKGKKKAQRFKIDEMKLKKPERWDGKWRLVMFDVPDNKKSARDYFKGKLDEFGFIQIQKSVYAHPFECKEEIELMRTLLEIRPFVKLLVAESFENEEKYLSKFGLAKNTTKVSGE